MSRRMTLLACKWEREFTTTLLKSEHDVIVVLDQFDVDHHEIDPALLEEARRVYCVSSFDALGDLAAVAADLRSRGESVDRVISFTEFSQLGAGFLQHLTGAEPTSVLDWVAVREKRLMKHRIREAGMRTAKSESLPDASDRAQREHIKRNLTFPVVVKPALGFGTSSTQRANDPDHFDDVLDRFRFDPLVPSRQLIVEEFVTGRELYVEALWVDGEPTFFVAGMYVEPKLSLVTRLGAGGAESVADTCFLLAEEENKELYERLMAMNRKANETFGVSTAATEMELFETPEGDLVFSEMCTRIGGGPTVPILSEYYGEPIWPVIARGLVGTPSSLRPARRYAGSMNLAPNGPGIVVSMPSPEEVAAIPGVAQVLPMVKVGDFISLEDGADWYFMVIFASDDRGEFDAAMGKVLENFEIITEPSSDQAR